MTDHRSRPVHSTIPERVAAVEEQIKSMERRVDELETGKVSLERYKWLERLAIGVVTFVAGASANYIWKALVGG